MDTREILLKAADYMERHGKASGTYRALDGRVCAVGALFCTSRESYVDFIFRDDDMIRALHRLAKWIDPMFVTKAGRARPAIVVEYSDTHTQVEVVEAMRKAAELMDWED